MDTQHGGGTMSASTGGRQTVAAVAAQQGQLEGRVTGLERDMQNMSQAVAALTDTVRDGFAETREMMASASRRQDERTSEIHQRLDKQAEKAAERNKPNWGFVAGVVSIIWAAIGGCVVWGMSQATQVAVVRTKADFMQSQIGQLDVVLQREMKLSDDKLSAEIKRLDEGLQREMRMLNDASNERHMRQDDRLDDHHLEIEKLHLITNQMIIREISHSDETGYIRARVEALERALDTKTADRFFGREGPAIDARLRSLEDFVRDLPCLPESK